MKNVRVIPWIVVAALFGVIGGSYGADRLKESDSLTRLKSVLVDHLKTGPGSSENAINDLVKHLDFLLSKRAEMAAFKLNLGASYSGHQAGNESLHCLGLETKIGYENYPYGIRFNGGTGVIYKNGFAQESVTGLLLNCDYYLSPLWEAYAFVERFSDSYMSILERYEIGVGLECEADVLRPASWRDVDDLYEEGLRYFDGLSNGTGENENLRILLADVRREEKRLRLAERKAKTSLQLALAITVFSEFEQGQIETAADTFKVFEGTPFIVRSKDTLKFPLAGSQRYRLVLRPTIKAKPSELVSIVGQVYFKLPLFGGETGVYDWRADARTLIDVSLGRTGFWNGEIKLSLEYRGHFDSLPPRLPESVIEEYRAANQILRKIVAEKIHHECFVKLSIGF